MDAAHDTHQLTYLINNILLFFGLAGISVPLLQRFRISPVVGYLLCGIAIGPHGLAQLAGAYPWLHHVTITDTQTVHTLGELGIIALMCVIGLELSFNRLRELRRLIVGLGGAQILVSALVIFAVAHLFGNGLEAAILIGASLALSSTAIVMKLLDEKKLTGRPVGIVCFSVLLMQDLAVVPIVVLTSTLASADGTGSLLSAMASAIALGAVTVTAIYVLGRGIIRPLLKSISFSSSPEWLVAFAVFVVVGCAALTQMAGLSLALGAFMAGLLIAETEFKHEVEVIIAPLKGLLLGIFFLSIGMMVDVGEVLRNPLLLGLSVLGIYLIKTAITLPLALLFKVPPKQATQTALYLAQPGEFALLILGIAGASQLMPAQDVQFFLLVTVLAMIFSPLLFTLAPLAGNWAQSRFDPNAQEQHSWAGQRHHARIIIAGMGRVGVSVARELQSQDMAYLALDMDGERIHELRKQQGFSLIYGDARKRELWQRLIDEHIQTVVIALDDPKAVRRIIQLLHSAHPHIHIIARAHHPDDCDTLYTMGAHEVVVETQEASLRIAQLVTQRT